MVSSPLRGSNRPTKMMFRCSPTNPATGLVGEHQNVIFVGRFDPRNGLDTMLAAYRQLFAERGASVRLIIVGDGPLRTRYERGIPARIRPYVHFAGRLNRSRPGHLAAADVFCTPCHRASFGMALLEAMSCGKATVASRIGGFELLLDHGRHGRLAHPGCHRSFADELRHLLDNHQAREHYGQTSRATVLANYCWKHIGHRLEHYYTTLRQTGRGDPSLPTSKQMATT